MKELLHMIKFVLDTADWGLKIKPQPTNTEIWEVLAYCESDWGGDPESRHSVSGMVICVYGVPGFGTCGIEHTGYGVQGMQSRCAGWVYRMGKQNGYIERVYRMGIYM